MKKIIVGALLATCLAFGREATFGDMLDAIVSFGNGYLEVKNNQGRTIKLPLQLYGYKVMFEGLIDRDKSRQCISYKSLTEAQKARLALWKWSDTIEGRSTYPYQDDRQKQIEREAILLNDIATGTEEYKECQKVVIAKVGETIGKLFSIFRSDKQSPQAITALYQSQATTSYNVDTWANEIKKAREKARNTREHKEYLAAVEQAEKWISKLGLNRSGDFYFYDDKLHKTQFQKLQVTLLEKWEAYEATKEYKAWRALEKQALDSVNSALASTSEYQNAEIAQNKAHSTKEYKAMIKAQNAVRATQHFKSIEEVIELKNKRDYAAYAAYYDYNYNNCRTYVDCRFNIRKSKEFKAWQVANERFEATNEFKAWQVAVKAYQTTKEYKARELVKKEIRERNDYSDYDDDLQISNYVSYVLNIREFGIENSPCEIGDVYSFDFDCRRWGNIEPIIVPKNWEYDLWYGDDYFWGFFSYKDKEENEKRFGREDDDKLLYYDWEY